VRVHVVDPSAFTPPYDRALCRALAVAGGRDVEVTLVTSRFAYGEVAPAEGFAVKERFHRGAVGPAGSRVRLATKLLQHVPDMVSYARSAARSADIVHFQWLAVQPVDVHLLPRGVPLVLTAHDVLPREPRPGQLRAQQRLLERMDAVVVHSAHGRDRLIGELSIDPSKIHVIPHGAFTHFDDLQARLPPELSDGGERTRPVAVLPGLLRPYKGVDLLLEAWRRFGDDPPGELWICGLPRVPLPATLPPGVRVVPRFLSDPELAGVLRRADLVVLPYREIDQSGILYAALGLGRPLLLSAVGGFPEVAALGAAELVAPDDAAALAEALARLLGDPQARQRLAHDARAAAAGAYSWEASARRHLELYAMLRGS
jgi:glycosyltransferase involved in cell wall biosynthesis